MKPLKLLLAMLCCISLACKKNMENIPGEPIVHNVKAYAFYQGDCVMALDLWDISDPALKRYVYGPPYQSTFHCLNDSAQTLETDTNYWFTDTLEITCRMPTAEEVDAQCTKGKFVYVLKMKNLSLPHRR